MTVKRLIGIQNKMYCVSDPALLAVSLGIGTVVLLRWKSLPSDVHAVHTVLEYGRKLLVRLCANRPSISEHLSSTDHFPRPPRTPQPDLFSPDYVRTPSMTSLNHDVPFHEPKEVVEAPTTRPIDESSSEGASDSAESTEEDE